MPMSALSTVVAFLLLRLPGGLPLRGLGPSAWELSEPEAGAHGGGGEVLARAGWLDALGRLEGAGHHKSSARYVLILTTSTPSLKETLRIGGKVRARALRQDFKAGDPPVAPPQCCGK